MALVFVAVLAVFGWLMISRRLTATLALPLAALSIAIVALIPSALDLGVLPALSTLMNDVVEAGVTRLSTAIMAVILGAVLAALMNVTGAAERLVRYAAEYAGEDRFRLGLCGCQLGKTTIEGNGAYKLGAKSNDYNLAAFQKVGAGTTTIYIEDGTQFEWLEDTPKCSLQLSFETNRLNSIALQFRQMDEARSGQLFEQIKQELAKRYPAPLKPTSEDDPEGNRALKLEAVNGFIGLYMTVPKDKAVPDPYTPASYHVRLLMQAK